MSGRLGSYGDEHAWPLANVADGKRRDLRQIGPKSTLDAEKYYVKGKLPAGWCELTFFPTANWPCAWSFRWNRYLTWVYCQ